MMISEKQRSREFDFTNAIAERANMIGVYLGGPACLAATLPLIVKSWTGGEPIPAVIDGIVAILTGPGLGGGVGAIVGAAAGAAINRARRLAAPAI